MGRPRWLHDPENRVLLLDAVRQALPYELCADLIGVPRESFMRWLKRIGEGDFDCDFRHTLKAAQAQGVLKRNSTINRGGRGWQGPAWLNERRFAEFFKDQGKAPKSQTIVNTTGNVEVAASVDDVSKMTDDQINEQIARLEAARLKGN